MNYKAVLFDLDNTLIYNKPALEKTAQMFIDKFYVGDLDHNHVKERYMHCFRAGNPGIKIAFAEFVDEICLCDAVTFEQFETFWKTVYPSNTVKFETTDRVLDTLRESGYKIGIITNGPTEMQNKKIDAAQIRDKIDEIVISYSFGIHKPDVRIFNHAASLLGIEPAQCVFVGDHPFFDIQGAQNAGMTGIWIKGFWPKQGDPDYTIDDIGRVLDIL